MLTEARFQGIESNFPKPEENIRPHHLMLSWVQEAIARKSPPKAIARRVTTSYVSRIPTRPDYFEDVVGQSKASSGKFEESLASNLLPLSKMPDSGTLGVGPWKDGICGSCVVGNHCTETNYSNEGRLYDADIRGEDTDVQILFDSLAARGFIPGIDFKRFDTRVMLLDYGKKEIGRVTPVVREENAQGIAVSMGAVRLLIREGKLPRRTK